MTRGDDAENVSCAVVSDVPSAGPEFTVAVGVSSASGFQIRATPAGSVTTVAGETASSSVFRSPKQ